MFVSIRISERGNPRSKSGLSCSLIVRVRACRYGTALDDDRKVLRTHYENVVSAIGKEIRVLTSYQDYAVVGAALIKYATVPESLLAELESLKKHAESLLDRARSSLRDALAETTPNAIDEVIKSKDAFGDALKEERDAVMLRRQELLDRAEQVMGELKTPGVEVSPSLLLSKIKGRSKLLQTQSDELQGLLKMRKAVWQVIEASYPVDEGNGILAGEHAEFQVPPHIIEAHLRGLVKSYRILQARARTWAAAESALGLAGDAVDPGDGAQRIFVATLGYVQDLFQIDSLAGMIHGMNGVYSKLKEMHSVLQSIGSLADVEARSGSGARPSRILRAVQAKLEAAAAAAAAAAIPTPVPAGLSVLGPPPGF